MHLLFLTFEGLWHLMCCHKPIYWAKTQC